MARLFKTSESGAELLVPDLEIADGFWSRGKGLLGRKSLQSNEALWITPGNNIHTFFMKFSIDCVFVDRKMEIKNLAKNVDPFRFVGPFWKSHSVIEMQAGFIESRKLKIGDYLYVVN